MDKAINILKDIRGKLSCEMDSLIHVSEKSQETGSDQYDCGGHSEELSKPYYDKAEAYDKLADLFDKIIDQVDQTITKAEKVKTNYQTKGV